MKPFTLLLRLALGALFVYAGAVKAWDTQLFALDVHNYQLSDPAAALLAKAFPALRVTGFDLSILIAVYLPWLEIFAGLALIVRRLTLGALALLSALMLAFTAALGSAWARGLDISCGCFGRETVSTNFPAVLARDLALLAGLLFLLWREVRAARPAHAAAGDAPDSPTA